MSTNLHRIHISKQIPGFDRGVGQINCPPVQIVSHPRHAFSPRAGLPHTRADCALVAVRCQGSRTTPFGAMIIAGVMAPWPAYWAYWYYYLLLFPVYWAYWACCGRRIGPLGIAGVLGRVRQLCETDRHTKMSEIHLVPPS